MKKTLDRIKKRKINSLEGLFNKFEARMMIRNWRKTPISSSNRLVWNSKKQGTYIKAIHGELK